MLLLKSFYRKKTTKIYFVLMIIITISCSAFLILKKYYTELINDNYDGSFIMFEVSQNTIFTDLENVNIMYRGLNTKDILYPIIEFNERTIKDDSIIMSSDFSDQFQIGNKIISTTLNEKILKKELEITEFYKTDKVLQPFLINSNTFNQIIDKESKIIYIGICKNWLHEKKTVKKIEEQLNAQVIEFISKKHESNYDEIIFAVNLFIILVIIAFVILNILLIINIIYDESKSNILYKSLGYSSKKINQILLYKIGSLIGISSIFIIIIFCFF